MEAAISELLPLLGPSAWLVHGLRSADGIGGGDLDCVVPKLDRSWPLRLPAGWRLCQQLRYDVTGHYWVLDRAGKVIAVDALADDAVGMGCYGFPTRPIVAAAGNDAARAAYLTAKRLRKRNRSADAWRDVARLARKDPASYVQLVNAVLGRRLGPRAASAVLAGRDPGPWLGRAVRARRILRMLAMPNRFARFVGLTVGRLVERAVHPTGLVVVVAGPDGTGKSTLAAQLPSACAGLFRRSRQVHFRDGYLPRPGAVVRKPAGDPTRPHGQPPHGRLLSVGVLMYHWLDAQLEAWLRLAPARRRTTLVVVERGWWDIAVDPRRYRLDVPPRLVRLLGRALPSPDLILLLTAPGAVVVARKPELEPDAIDAQIHEWRAVAPAEILRELDAAQSPGHVLLAARELVVRVLERRAAAAVAGGWTNIGSRDGEPRLVLPRRPRGAAVASLSLYRPAARKTRIAWNIVRAGAALGGWRFLPRRSAPSFEVRAALAGWLPAGGTVATAASNHPGRCSALIADRDGAVVAFAKVATDAGAVSALVHEAEAITSLGHLLGPSVRPPRIMDVAPGVLLLEPLTCSGPVRADGLPSEVVEAVASLERAGFAHGDFAPWNLVREGDGWVLVDWEAAGPSDLPFADLAHYLVQSHALLGWPTESEILDATRGVLSELVQGYADAAGLAVGQWREALASYLRRGPRDTTRDPRRVEALASRRRLLEAISG
jgi:hypothetical protein